MTRAPHVLRVTTSKPWAMINGPVFLDDVELRGVTDINLHMQGRELIEATIKMWVQPEVVAVDKEEGSTNPESERQSRHIVTPQKS